MSYFHGVKAVEINGGSRPIQTVATSIIGLVATADDADANTFPEGEATLITSISSVIDDAGTTGTLAASLNAIKVQANAVMVVVRVAEDAVEANQDANVIAGLDELLNAEPKLGVHPRILGCPGLDTLPVATHMAGIAQNLNGMAYISAWGATTKEEAATYRGNFSQREIMVIWPSFTNYSQVAVALGLRAKLDVEQGWHKSLSNVGVNSVTGLDTPVSFELTSTAHDAHYLNSNDVTALIRKDGFRFWGSRTCSDDPLFAFESTVRSGQVIKDTIAEAHMWAIDKPLTPFLAKDIVEGIQAKLDNMVAQGYLLGATVWLDDDLNSASQLAAGNLVVDYDYTPVYPLEGLTFNQRITDRYTSRITQGLTT